MTRKATRTGRQVIMYRKERKAVRPVLRRVWTAYYPTAALAEHAAREWVDNARIV